MPEFSWSSARPESRGMDGRRLDVMCEALAERGTRGLLIMRHDRIVYEWYASDDGPDKPHFTASLAKAIVGGTSLMLALNDGLMAIDDLACKYIPAWREDSIKSRITIRHLATHSSGLQDANMPGKSHEELPGWMGAFWRRDPDPFTISRDQTPVIFEPGTEYAYSNPGMAMLAYAVTAAFQGTRHQDIRTLLQERIMGRMGVPQDAWSVGYGTTYMVDGLPLVANWGGGGFTARAVAQVGLMMLHRGEWRGRGHLVDSAWVDRMIADAGTPTPPRTARNPRPCSGLCWWLNADGVWPAVPRDAFAGSGAQNQILLVIPSLDMVVVRNGRVLGDDPAGEDHYGAYEKYLLNPIMQSVLDQPAATATANMPYPPSRIIRGVAFAPVDEIVRDCVDSDNFPITWMDNGDQLVAYGDGWGFEPHTERKLSLGFGRVIGPPEKFLGVNVRSESGEREGGGAAGLKASGMLMVDGVLYMWVRNASNAQLAWSEDRGATWEWGFKLETSFGCPTLMNAGQNYGDAPDGFVYVYSQDGPTAYQPYDGIVMARVPTGRIRDSEAYEFFHRMGQDGQPVWTADIARRGHVFHYLGRCMRLDAVYHPGLQRYLLLVGFNHSGGWGIFDGPKPWGPWTTAFHTVYWGLGSTHYYRLPSKWLSDDGKTAYLVFSGRNYDGVIYDAMCVRRMTIEPGGQPAEDSG